MKQQYHKTVKFKGWNAGEGEGIDEAIQDALKLIAQQKGSIRLLDFKIYTIETQSLPLRHEIFLTVMAEEVDE